MWDHGLPYYVRAFRLAVRTPDDAPVTAEIRYLGTQPWPSNVFARRVEALELPARAVAGTAEVIPLRVRNTSPAPWAGGGPLAVRLSYRLEALDGSGEVIEGPRTALANVASGGVAVDDLEITWPERPGPYRLTVDLLIEGVAWFAGRVGEPLGQIVVEIDAVSSAPRSSGPGSGAPPGAARRPR